MKTASITWAGRILAIGFALFLALFALDAWDTNVAIGRRLVGIATHLLPSLLVAVAIVISWRRPWIGGALFLALAIAYAVMVRFRADWVLVISGPLLTVGLLYIWSWQMSRSPAS
jgi:hypothetical protein